MESIKDEFGFYYELVSVYRNGYMILFQSSGSNCHWVIRTPENQMIRFETEAALWQYALKNKLFRKRQRREADG